MNRLLVDSDGKQYRFSNFAFQEAVGAELAKQRKLNKDNIKKGTQQITREAIVQSLASKIHLSNDTIKKWDKGANGPGDIEKVKDCANALGIDYHSLLEFEGKQETIEVYNRSLIENVYQSSIKFLFDLFDPSSKKMQFLICEDDTQRQEILTEFRKIHEIISLNSVYTSIDLQNKLHQLLVDEEMIVYRGGMPDRWFGELPYAIHLYGDCLKFGLEFHDSRIDAIRDVEWVYLQAEMIFAQDMGLEYKGFDEEFDELETIDNEDDYVSAISQYGLGSNTLIKPALVCKHMLAKYISKVFQFYLSDYM